MGAIRRGVAGVAALLGFSAVLLARDPHSAVPFKLYGGYTIVVSGSIGRLERLNFVIDTGAVPTVVDQRIAMKLHLSGQKESLWLFSGAVQEQRVVVPMLRIGPIQVPSLPGLVQDLSFIEQGLGTRIDAIVGLDVLGLSEFCLDYEARELSLSPTGLRGSTARIEPGLSYVVVHLEVRGQPLRLLLDTGTRDIILFEPGIWDRLPGLRIIGEKVSSNIGGQVRLRQVELSAAHLGDANLGNLSVYVMHTGDGPGVELDGLLGVTALGAKRVEFNVQQNIVTWK